MKKNFSRLIGFGLACVMTASLAACNGNTTSTETQPAAAATEAASGQEQGEAAAPAATGEKKVIKFFHRFPDDPANSFIEAKLAEYEASHPDIQFEITSAQNQPYKEKIQVVVGSEECPDIFFSWGGRVHREVHP